MAKLKGDFAWHKHAEQDEMFLVVEGHLVIRLRDQDVELGAGEFSIVPRDVEHMPVADDEVNVFLFEPVGTAHAGDVITDKTVDTFERI